MLRFQFIATFCFYWELTCTRNLQTLLVIKNHCLYVKRHGNVREVIKEKHQTFKKVPKGSKKTILVTMNLVMMVVIKRKETSRIFRLEWIFLLQLKKDRMFPLESSILITSFSSSISEFWENNLPYTSLKCKKSFQNTHEQSSLEPWVKVWSSKVVSVTSYSSKKTYVSYIANHIENQRTTHVFSAQVYIQVYASILEYNYFKLLIKITLWGNTLFWCS